MIEQDTSEATDPGPGPSRERPAARARRARSVLAAVLVSLAVVAASLAVRSSSAFGEESAPLLPLPADVVDTATNSGEVDVVVQLADPQRGRTAAAVESSDPASTAAAAQRLVEEVGADPAESDVLPNMGVVELTVDSEQLDRVARSPLVVGVEADRLLAPALDQVASTIGAGVAWANQYTGAGQTIAIIDSGIDQAHPALQGKVIAEACFTDRSCPGGSSVERGPGSAKICAFGSQCDHGTHVAGIAAGAHSRYQGIAPGASLVSIQIFSRSDDPNECGTSPTPCPRARTSDVLSALEEVFTMRASVPGLVAVNLSLSSNSAVADCSGSSLRGAIEKLRGVGIATIAASGNGGFTDGLGVPACIPSTISVGATYPTSDAIWPLSNISGALDLLAPGVGVVSPAPGGTFAATTGTSAAAPVVAGAWAVTAERLGTTNVEEIEQFLEGSGRPLTYAANGVTVPRVDLAAIAPAALQPANGLFRAVNSDDMAAEATPTAGDFDGDGNGDLFWYDPAGTDFVWFGLGNGRFEQRTSYPLGPGYEARAGDFDGDGRDDLLLYAPNGGDVVWYGTGHRVDGQQFVGVQTLSIWGGVTLLTGDFDGDGTTDVFQWSPGGRDRMWYGQRTRQSQAQFREVPTYAIGAGWAPVTGDFDADGRHDILWYAPASGIGYLFSGSASQVTQFTGSLFPYVGTGYSLAAGDFNGDRRADLVLHDQTGGRADEVRILTPAGTLTTAESVVVGSEYGPVVENFDGDSGSKDDVFWNGNGQKPNVAWLAN